MRQNLIDPFEFNTTCCLSGQIKQLAASGPKLHIS